MPNTIDPYYILYLFKRMDDLRFENLIFHKIFSSDFAKSKVKDMAKTHYHLNQNEIKEILAELYSYADLVWGHDKMSVL